MTQCCSMSSSGHISFQEILGGPVLGPGIPCALHVRDCSHASKCSVYMSSLACIYPRSQVTLAAPRCVHTGKLCHLPEVTQLITVGWMR